MLFWWGLGATVICMLQAWLDAGCACAYFTLDVTDAPYGFRARERQPRGPWGLGRGARSAISVLGVFGESPPAPSPRRVHHCTYHGTYVCVRCRCIFVCFFHPAELGRPFMHEVPPLPFEEWEVGQQREQPRRVERMCLRTCPHVHASLSLSHRRARRPCALLTHIYVRNNNVLLINPARPWTAPPVVVVPPLPAVEPPWTLPGVEPSRLRAGG